MKKLQYVYVIMSRLEPDDKLVSHVFEGLRGTPQGAEEEKNRIQSEYNFAYGNDEKAPQYVVYWVEHRVLD